MNKIGSFLVLDKLGEGAMGVVYLGYNETTGTRVAIKKPAEDSSSVSRFLQECNIMSKLEHENIVKVLEFSDRHSPYMAMEYVEGGDLSQYLKVKKFTPKKACEMICKICAGIDYAHRKGIIHRDIKPENIMLNGLEPKIMDFGIAKNEEKRMTKTGVLMGTLEYMSPEQANGKGVDKRSDVYSLGCVFYKMLTGRVPIYLNNTSISTILDINRKYPLPPKKHNPTVPKELSDICLKSLNKKRYNRYQTASEMSSDIEKYLSRKSFKVSNKEYIGMFHRNKLFITIFSCIFATIFSFAGLFYFMDQSRKYEKQNILLKKALMSNRIEVLYRKSFILFNLYKTQDHRFSSVRENIINGFKELDKVYPNNFRLLKNFAFLFLQIGEYRNSINYYNDCLKIKENENALVERAFAFYKEGKFESCVKDCNKCISLNKNNAKAYYYKGISMKELNNLPGAISSFEECKRSMKSRKIIDNHKLSSGELREVDSFLRSKK